jgi:hypothetical protein
VFEEEPGTTTVVPGSSHVRTTLRRHGPTLWCMKTCDFCGRQAEDDQTLTWTTSVENGRKRTYCEQCSRDHLRAIEGKLDAEWW